MRENKYLEMKNEAVAEELATEHCGFYSDKKQGVVAAFFLSQIHRSWGLVAHLAILRAVVRQNVDV